MMKTCVYTKECDVYSFGMVMFEIFTGTPPFNGIDNKTIRQKVGLPIVARGSAHHPSDTSRPH